MAAKATIEPFDGGDFSEYRERLTFFFCANEIGVVAANANATEKARVAKRMTAYLISLLSKTVYSTLKTERRPPTNSGNALKVPQNRWLNFRTGWEI